MFALYYKYVDGVVVSFMKTITLRATMKKNKNCLKNKKKH